MKAAPKSRSIRSKTNKPAGLAPDDGGETISMMDDPEVTITVMPAEAEPKTRSVFKNERMKASREKARK